MTQSAPRIPLRYSINVGNELRAVLILTPIVPFVRCSLAENKRQIYERIKQRPRRAVVNGLRDNGGRAYKKKRTPLHVDPRVSFCFVAPLVFLLFSYASRRLAHAVFIDETVRGEKIR